MQETVLLYNFADEYRKKQMTGMLTSLHLVVKNIPRQEYEKPIGYLAGISGVLPLGNVYEGEELPGEMMVFAGLSGEQIDKVLIGFREKGLKKVDYKAVLTPTNQYWNGLQLFEELKREHESFKQ